MLAHSAVKSYIGRTYVGPPTVGATKFINDGRAASLRDKILKSEEVAYTKTVAKY